jgi:hypothetical protein
VTKAMKDWLDDQMRLAGTNMDRDTDPRFRAGCAARIVALAQVRAEVWKLAPVDTGTSQNRPSED